jgi:hypothetical protein
MVKACLSALAAWADSAVVAHSAHSAIGHGRDALELEQPVLERTKFISNVFETKALAKADKRSLVFLVQAT